VFKVAELPRFLDYPVEFFVPFIDQRVVAVTEVAIGIGEAERRRRNLSFHSWRHWLNSQLIEAHVAPEKIRAVTGHSSSEMTMLYYHAQTSEMADVRAVQTRLERCFISAEER
jgi:integrase